MNHSWGRPDAQWYLGVRCRKCQLPILFALDRTDGDGHPVPTWKLVLTCTVDNCKHQADYTAAAVSRFQKPSASHEPVRNREDSKGRKQKCRT